MRLCCGHLVWKVLKKQLRFALLPPFLGLYRPEDFCIFMQHSSLWVSPNRNSQHKLLKIMNCA